MECKGGLGHLRPMRFVPSVTSTIVSNLGLGNHTWWESVVDPSRSILCSIGWFNWLDQLVGSVVGPHDWFMWSVHAVDPSGTIFGWFDRLLWSVGSIGWFAWMIRLDVSCGGWIRLNQVAQFGWLQWLLQMVCVCGCFLGCSQVGSAVGPFIRFTWLVQVAGSSGCFNRLLRLVAWIGWSHRLFQLSGACVWFNWSVHVVLPNGSVQLIGSIG